MPVEHQVIQKKRMPHHPLIFPPLLWLNGRTQPSEQDQPGRHVGTNAFESTAVLSHPVHPEAFLGHSQHEPVLPDPEQFGLEGCPSIERR